MKSRATQHRSLSPERHLLRCIVAAVLRGAPVVLALASNCVDAGTVMDQAPSGDNGKNGTEKAPNGLRGKNGHSANAATSTPNDNNNSATAIAGDGGSGGSGYTPGSGSGGAGLGGAAANGGNATATASPTMPPSGDATA